MLNLIGEIAALGCAPIGAIVSIMLKSQTDRLDSLQINAIRSVSGLIFSIAIVPFFVTASELSSLTILAVLYLWLYMFVFFILGDTIYIKGMGIIGVSRALPISVIYPIFVLPFSITASSESLSFSTVAGLFMTVGGLYFITAPKKGTEKPSDGTRKRHWWGVSLVLMACVFWAAGTVIIEFAVVNLNPVLAGAVHMPFMTATLFATVYMRKSPSRMWKQSKRSLMILFLAGILGLTVAGPLFMLAVKYAGPTKAATLSATAPLFGLPFSMLILHEKITLKIVLGTVLCVAGIWFVI